MLPVAAPNDHRTVDLVVLLVLLGPGSQQLKQASSCLNKKMLEGHASLAWLTKSITSHKVGIMRVDMRLYAKLCFRDTSFMFDV
jgi:hypothetical protein